MLETKESVLVVIDVQGKLAQLMCEKAALFTNIAILIKSAKILNIPILWCQQNPKALGPTIEELAELLVDEEPIDKMSFSCYGDDKFREILKKTNRNQVILCGIEAHVCICQTAINLLEDDYKVYVVADAVSSRTEQNRQIALERMNNEGAIISSVEMTLFELLRTAEHEKFKEIARLIK